MNSAKIKKGGEVALSIGVILWALGIYFGNAWIGGAHGCLVLGMLLLLVGRWIERRSGSLEVERSGEGWRFRLPGSGWVLLGLIAWSVVTVLVNADTIDSELSHIKKLRHLLFPLLLLCSPLFFGVFVKNRRLSKWVVIAWLVSVSTATAAGLIAHFTGFNPILMEPPSMPTRASGLFSQVMTFANSLQFSVLLLSASLVIDSNRNKWFWIRAGVLLLAIVGMYFSYTRGAILGAAAGMFFLLWLFSKKWLAIVSTIGVIIAVAAFMGGTRHFLALKHEEVRINQWKVAALTVVEHPVFGVGYRNFDKVCGTQKEKFGMPEDHPLTAGYFVSHAHNNILEYLAATGFVGAALFLAFCGVWAIEVGRVRRLRLLVQSSIVALLVSGMVECNFFDSEVISFIMLIYLFSQVALIQENSRDEGAAEASTLQ